MGAAVWFAAGVVTFLFARIVPLRRTLRWLPELAVAVVAALLAGVMATLLDFGGWNEPDWRAGLFAFFVSAAAIGLVRALR
jgi:hypothetical protein